MLCTCCGGFTLWGWSFIQQALITDPIEAQSIGRQIADYTLPEGYTEFLAIDFKGAKSVAIVDDALSPAMMIFLMQAPDVDGLSDADLEAQLQALIQQFNLQSIDYQPEQTESRSVNGQDVQVHYKTGTDSNGKPFKQVTAFIHSSHGKAFLMVQGPEESWDQKAIERFLDSIQ